MKKNIKLVFIAVVVLAVLSVGYLLADKFIGKPQTEEPDNGPSVMDEVIVETTPMWEYQAEEINRVEFNLNDYSYTIKPGNPYTIEGYESSLMSSINLQTAVGFVSALPVVRTIDTRDEKLPQYGIDEKSQSVIIYFNDDTRQTLKLGNETGVDNEVYAYDVENKVLGVLTKDGYERLTAEPGKYRNHKICTLNNYFIRKMEVTNSKGMVIGIEQGDSTESYVMTYPYEGAEVSYEKIHELLGTFEEIKADEIVEEFPADTAKYGFDKPLTAYIFDSGQEHTLMFGNTAENGGIYIMYGDRPVVYRGTCAIYETIKNIEPVSYLVPRVHLTDLSEVTEVTVKQGKKTVTLKWNPDKGTSCTINGKSVSADEFKKKYQLIIGMDYSDIADVTGELKEYCSVNFTLKDKTTKKYVYYVYDESYCVVKGDNGLNCMVLTNNVDTMISDIQK